jgi:hypothetical protein
VPKAITEAVYVSGGVRYPLRLLTPQLWSRIQYQGIGESIPGGIYFDRGYPIANIYLYPQPASGDLELYVWHVIPGVQTLSDVVVIPSGYEDALVLNLAGAWRLPGSASGRRQRARVADAPGIAQRAAAVASWTTGVLRTRYAYGGVAVISSGGGSNGSRRRTGPPGPPGPWSSWPQGPPGTAGGPQGPQGATGPTGRQDRRSCRFHRSRWAAESRNPGAGHCHSGRGVALTQRATLNFAGAGVTATDDGAGRRWSYPVAASPGSNNRFRISGPWAMGH